MNAIGILRQKSGQEKYTLIGFEEISTEDKIERIRSSLGEQAVKWQKYFPEDRIIVSRIKASKCSEVNNLDGFLNARPL